LLNDLIARFSSEIQVAPVRRGAEPSQLDSDIATQIVVRWAIRIVFLKHAHIFGTQRLIGFFERSIEDDSAYDFPQLLRLLLEQGIHEPSQSARQRIVKLCGEIEYWGEALEPPEWISDDIAHNSRRLIFPLELF
jgi:hypothetical protein